MTVIQLIQLMYRDLLELSSKDHSKPNFDYIEFEQWLLGENTFNNAIENWSRNDGYHEELEPTICQRNRGATFGLKDLKITVWCESKCK